MINVYFFVFVFNLTVLIQTSDFRHNTQYIQFYVQSESAYKHNVLWFETCFQNFYFHVYFEILLQMVLLADSLVFTDSSSVNHMHREGPEQSSSGYFSSLKIYFSFMDFLLNMPGFLA